MISPAEIRVKLLRRYPDFLRAWLRNETLFPLDMPVGRVSEQWGAFREETDALIRGSKAHQRYGYRVETLIKSTKRFGRQELPARIWIDGEHDFLALTGKHAEFEQFQADVGLVRTRLPALEAWLHAHPDTVIKFHGKWHDLIEVCAYFLAYPTTDRTLRELPINVHTKFIEQHTGILRRLFDELLPNERINPDETRFNRRYGLREADTLIRLRFLDDQFRRRYHAPISDLSAPLSEIAQLDFLNERILIVENLTTFLSLPTLSNVIAIFGRGFDASQLGRVEWLRGCTVFYWGDLDAQGFQILALLRRALPQARSLLMDVATFDAFSTFAVPGIPTAIQSVPELTPNELQLYHRVAERNLRLEQERIDLEYIEAALCVAFK
jgi:hypothetical protein